jgi:hypothetical protein
MQDNSRWWEFYFVRYAIGTLTGALLVNQASRLSPELAKIVFFQIDLQKEVYAGTSLLLGYGLLFCYIASIPILVWHSARFVAPKAANLIPSRFLTKFGAGMSGLRLGFASGLVAIAGLLLLQALLFLWKNSAEQDFLIKLGILSGLAVLWFEWGALIWLLFNMERAYQSLRSLAEARYRNQNKGGMIDSYRHLREHGNSILIVLLELILGGILLGMLHVVETDPAIAESIKIKTYAAYSIPILVLWMVPGAAMWFVAASFEKRFSELESNA